MKEKHRKRILNDPNKDKKLIKAQRKRLQRELLKDGSDFDSNAKYLSELNRWKH